MPEVTATGPTDGYLGCIIGFKKFIMTKFFALLAAVTIFAPVAFSLMGQAARIVA